MSIQPKNKASKILALDLGASRIGVAISEGALVSTFPIIDSKNRDEAMQQIFKIVRRENIEKIVLGLPKGNQESEDLVRSFAIELTKELSLPIEFEDETLTSKEAARLLRNSKIDPKSGKYKQEIDKLSAKLILEQYLRSQ